MVQRERHVGEDMSIEMKHYTINTATKLVIPAVAKRRAGIQKDLEIIGFLHSQE